jgi:hypothetical protein
MSTPSPASSFAAREGDVVVGVLPERPPAELDRGEALLLQFGDGVAHLGLGVRHEARRVRAHASRPHLA